MSLRWGSEALIGHACTVQHRSQLQGRTSAAGREVGSLRSACTVVAPQSRRKSAGFCRGRTMQRTCAQQAASDAHRSWHQLQRAAIAGHTS